MKQNALFMAGLVLCCLGMGPAYGAAWPASVFPAPEPDLEGTWQGRLSVGATSLRIVFNVTKADDGALSATLDSPDQGATGIPVAEVVVAGDTVRFEVTAIGGVYSGVANEDGSKIEGTWSQSGQSLPLVLERVEEAPEVNRPQEPEPPYPYKAEDVRFENAGAGVTLAGTLTLPEGAGPFPAVVLISGSGPQDRDEALMGHRPFFVLADYLTRRGIAVLRFDDRGVGASTGDFAAATSVDFAGDARAGVAYLATRDEVDVGRIGLAGHSEGGLIAPMVAAEESGVAFIVLMAGPGLTGEEILYAQGALINRANGTPEEAVGRNRAVQERLFAVLKEEADADTAGERLRAIMREQAEALGADERAATGDTEAAIEAQVRQLNSPWFRYFLTYNPAPTLARVSCPVLAINGEKDLQVPAQENLRAIEAALQAGGNANYEVHELAGLNHLFQPAETGSPTEYAGIEETFSPTAMALIADWILQRAL